TVNSLQLAGTVMLDLLNCMASLPSISASQLAAIAGTVIRPAMVRPAMAAIFPIDITFSFVEQNTFLQSTPKFAGTLLTYISLTPHLHLAYVVLRAMVFVGAGF